jgi:signal transduction histidine kinase
MFEDLQHQVIGPILQAEIRLRFLSGTFAGEREVLRCLGLAGKSRRVAARMGFFAALSQGKQLEVVKSRLTFDYVLKLLIEGGQDAELLRLDEPPIKFWVEAEGLRAIDHWEVMADKELLEQAVYNLIDNAEKYSHYLTTVRLFGGILGEKWFHITVENEGVGFTEEERKRAAERGFRGTAAKSYTGQGSGIGLWFVENVMRVQGGKLEIPLAKEPKKTEVRLLFPCKRKDVPPV